MTSPARPPSPSAFIGAPVPDWRTPPAPERNAMRGAYCLLEPLDPAQHGEALWQAIGRPERADLWRFMKAGPFEAQADFAAWLDDAAASVDPQFYALIPLQGPNAGKAMGAASYLRIDPASGSVEIGHITLSPELQRSRAATEAWRLMMARVFEGGYRRCEWKCNAENAASRAAAQRLGLSYEGVFRQMMVIKGCNRDTAWYAAIDSEWPALNAAFEQWLAPENFDAEGRQKTSLSALTAPLLVKTG